MAFRVVSEGIEADTKGSRFKVVQEGTGPVTTPQRPNPFRVILSALQEPSRRFGSAVQRVVGAIPQPVIPSGISPISPSSLVDPSGAIRMAERVLLRPEAQPINRIAQAEQRAKGQFAGEAARTFTNPIDLSILAATSPVAIPSRIARALIGGGLGAGAAYGDLNATPQDIALNAATVGLFSAIPGAQRAKQVVSRGIPPESWLIPAERPTAQEAAQAAQEAFASMPAQTKRIQPLKTAAQLALEKQTPKGNLPVDVGISHYSIKPETKPSIQYPEGRTPRTRTAEGGFVALPEEESVKEGIKRGAIKSAFNIVKPELSEKPLAPRLQVPATEEIISSAERLINRDPADQIASEEVPRLFKRIGQALREGRIAADDIPGLRDAGIGTEEAANLFEQAGTFSGQTLNRLSQLAKQIKLVAPNLADELDKQAKIPPTAWQRIAVVPRNVVNIWKASLVSQMATAVRNLAVFHQRYAFRVIEDAANGAFESITGKKATVQAFGPMLEDLAAYARALRSGQRAKVLDLISKTDPLLKEKLWQTPINDVAMTGKYAKLLGTFNNAQEYFARTIVADAVMAGELRRSGQTTLTVPIVKKAVDRALDITFAKYPTSKFGREFVKTWNNPILNVLTYPFPRYLTNSVRAIWEYSPAGAMRLIHPKYQAILKSSDPRAAVEVATKAALGSTMFAAASWIRNSQYAGEKWYEVNVNGKTIDVRPFGPLLPVYLFVAQAIKDPSQFEPRDYFEGMLGINRMAGTTLFITSILAGKNPDTIKKKLAEFSGQFAGGFTIPLRTFQDFVAQFSKEEATIRETRLSPLTAPAQANIPFASRQLPEKRFLTKGGAVFRENPAIRQVSGISSRTKSFLEKELDRSGLSYFDLIPKVGNSRIEYLFADQIGGLAEEIGNELELSPEYNALYAAERKEFLSEIYKDLRAEAKNIVLSQDAGQIADIIAKDLTKAKSEREVNAVLNRYKQKGLLSQSVKQELGMR